MDDNDTSITSVTPSPPPSPTIPQTPQSIDQQHPNTISSPDPSDVATDDHNSTVSPPTIPSIHIHTSSPLSSPRATRHLNNDIESNTQNHQSINNINDNNDIQLTPIKPIHNSDLLHNDLPPPPQKVTLYQRKQHILPHIPVPHHPPHCHHFIISSSPPISLVSLLQMSFFSVSFFSVESPFI
eukprot:TRINITY_DN2679_c0_g1_i5.p1 TRINITY_DN2679_c0_g1~~TRINITY_DN2679_c0_g1_i5.p1  ORF type:complete len:190 (-),score=15.65 TRINITY_DN2679_c0_g1_i5:42-590(-)